MLGRAFFAVRLGESGRPGLCLLLSAPIPFSKAWLTQQLRHKKTNEPGRTLEGTRPALGGGGLADARFGVGLGARGVSLPAQTKLLL